MYTPSGVITPPPTASISKTLEGEITNGGFLYQQKLPLSRIIKGIPSKSVNSQTEFSSVGTYQIDNNSMINYFD